MKRIPMVLIVVPILVVLVHAGADFIAIDRCLDSGGAFDYSTRTCRTDGEPVPYVPYWRWYGWLVAGAASIVVAGAVLGAVQKGRSLIP